MCSIFITVQHSVLLPDEIYHISVSVLLSISVHRIFAGKIIGATYIQFYNDIFFFYRSFSDDVRYVSSTISFE